MAHSTLTNSDINQKTLINSDYTAIEIKLSRLQRGEPKTPSSGTIHFASANPFFDNTNYGHTTTNVIQKQLDVSGQGIVIIEMDQPIPFTLTLKPARSRTVSEYQLILSASETNVTINDGSGPITSTHTDHVESPTGIRNRYWLSIDKTTKVIKYGWGEPRPLLTTITLDCKHEQIQNLRDIFLEYPNNDAIRAPSDEHTHEESVLEHLTIRILPSLVPNKERSLLLLPVGVSFRHGREIPDDISPEVAKLYSCITYYKGMIDTGCQRFPEFIQAVRRSIVHQQGLCRRILEEKTKLSSFGLLGTYLRITFDEPHGNSPGHRFVLEIWPEDHFSPIHQHADAHGVIMVYHGCVLVSLYAALDPANQVPFKKKLFHTNDVTYLTRDLNQTHKVENVSQDVCLTMQCYQYEAGDQKHYGNFQILKNYDLEQTHPANPKSDMDFEVFLNRMYQEWITTYAREIQL